MEELQNENQQFEDWKNSILAPHCYLMKGANKVYAGIMTKGTGYVITFDGISMEDARKHIKIDNLRTNKDEHITVWDKEELSKCRKLCEDKYKIDVGLGYQVKSYQAPSRR